MTSTDSPQIKYLGQFVNVYLTGRAYGGPEEGGWWYDVGKIFIRATQVSDEDKSTLAAEQSWCDEENKYRHSDISSVLSEGKYVAYLEDAPGADYPGRSPPLRVTPTGGLDHDHP